MAEIRGTSLGTGTQGRTRCSRAALLGRLPSLCWAMGTALHCSGMSLHCFSGCKQEVRAQGCGLKTAGIAGNQGVAISSTRYRWRQDRVNTVQHLHSGTQCTLPSLEKLIRHRVQLPSRGTWTRGRNGLRGSFRCSRKGVQSPAPVREQPQAPTQAGSVQPGSTWSSWWAILSFILAAKSPTVSCAAVRGKLPAGPGRWPLLSTQHPKSCSGLPSTIKVDLRWIH